MQGWIKLHREIVDHWVYSNDSYYKAWTTIVMLVNHSKQKVLIKGTLFDCDRSESLMSLDKWAEKFGKNWNKSKVRRFFKLLESDKMIDLKSEQKTTRLKVCNYDTYNCDRNTNETQTKHKQNANETQMKPNKNDKNDKNDNNDNIYIPILTSWNEIGFKKCRKITDKHIRAINGIIKDKFEINEIKKSIILYAEIVNSEKTFYTHQFNLLDFLKQSNGSRRFIQANFNEYLKKDFNQTQNNSQSKQIYNYGENWEQEGMDFLNGKYND